ncbi:hypothetical protein SAMN05443377_101161 [Propionibacterium cyclohexanicum]|uniref:Probable membrane transporter protein n=2 Tax=Propionibacterium cyclohexanicum TaxID=64702 RepID=A0A1H9PPC3_9ACTN|nr:hypothetical protein SAMN05443377_101161 [Propionibacterium cyclohexanicum]
MVALSGWVLAGLVLAALVAGWVDAVVGGGGIIQLPALLIGLPAELAVASVSATNKLSSVAGTAMAAASYLRSVPVRWRAALPLVVTAWIGSSAGAQLVHFVPRKWFTPVVLVVLVGIGIYTVRRPELGLRHAPRREGAVSWLLLVTIGLVIGLWDGLMGPGTGSFLIIALVALLGYGFLQASALAKIANLATNLAALVVFFGSGHILWSVGLPMALANLVGGWLGSRTAIRYGSAFVRKVFLVVVVVIGVRLGWQVVEQFAH